VLKFGGGKVLTKHPSDEALKCHLTIEEPKVVEASTLVIYDRHAVPDLGDKPEVGPIKAVVKSKVIGLGKILPELYDLEACAKTEKPVKIDLDLDLYQMEKV
jgi:hypothetical protein